MLQSSSAMWRMVGAVTRSWRPGDAWRSTLEDLRAHPGTLAGVASILSLPVAIGALYQAVRPGLSGLAVSALLSALATLWLTFAVTLAIRDFRERPETSVSSLIRASTIGRVFSLGITQVLLGLLGLAALLVAGLPLILAAVTVFGGGLSPNRLSGTAILILVAALALTLALAVFLTVAVFVRYGLVAPVNILEGRSPLSSFGRSRELTNRRGRDMVMLLLMLFGVGLVVAIVLNGPASLVLTQPETPTPGPGPPRLEDLLSSLGPTSPLSPAAAAIVAVSSYLSSVVGTTLSAALTAHFYLAFKRGAESSLPKASEEGTTPVTTDDAGPI
ncbi:MAG: hypothetical protein M3164_03390 [Actinomycetota bacterium]|nr:hypothetical protein [Actinomycetota bacterium]